MVYKAICRACLSRKMGIERRSSSTFHTRGTKRYPLLRPDKGQPVRYELTGTPHQTEV